MRRFKKVVFVDSYLDAPDNAKYILRKMSDEWVFEKYFNNTQWELATFPHSIGRNEDDFASILAQCRSLVGNSQKIWSEFPECFIPYNKSTTKDDNKAFQNWINTFPIISEEDFN